LFTSISITDADFVVNLIDVFPDDFTYSDNDKYIMNGYQMLVCGDIFRGRFRNSFEKPEPFVPMSPGQVMKKRFSIFIHQSQKDMVPF
jgi:predicted acyl esterase